MKTYAIALKRSKERYSYIQQHLTAHGLDFDIIDAIDGSMLTDEEIQSQCNMEQVNKYRRWLSNGAIGCALSHMICYEALVQSGNKAALIVEDDAVLPTNISDLLKIVEQKIQPSEVILLYYTSFQACELSTINAQILADGQLLYPMNIEQPITATAYIIGQEAAQGMLNHARPIAVTADTWHYFHSKGAFSSFRVQYPMSVHTKNFKSAIDYIDPNSMKGKISQWINDYKIPFAYQYLSYLRKKRLNEMQGHFTLVDKVSPIQQEG